MRHAGSAPGSVGALAIAMVEAPLGALLVAPTRGAETAGPPCPPTREAAVHVAAITRGTEEEGLPAEAAGPHQEDLHGPAGPEMSGGQWTRTRECATTLSSRPYPRGVGAPEGLEGRAPGPHPSPSGVAAAYPKTDLPSTLSGRMSGFIRFQMSDNTREAVHPGGHSGRPGTLWLPLGRDGGGPRLGGAPGATGPGQQAVPPHGEHPRDFLGGPAT